MVRTNEKLHQDLQAHQLQILPIRQYSDGRARICPCAIAKKNNRYGKRRIAEFWANDRTSGIAVQAGRTPELIQLPAGYDCWQLDKPNPRSHQNGNRQATTTEYIVTGHPQGDFSSIAKFYVHFKHIQDHGTTSNCPCDRCVAARGRQAGGAATQNMIAPATTIPQANHHQVVPQPQAVPSMVQAIQGAQQTVIAPIAHALITPSFPPQQNAGAMLSGQKRSAPPTYPTPPAAKRLKFGWQNHPSTTDDGSHDSISGLGHTQLTPRVRPQALHLTEDYADPSAAVTFSNPRQHPSSDFFPLQGDFATQQTHGAFMPERQSGTIETQSVNHAQQPAPYGGASSFNDHHLSDSASSQSISSILQCDICGELHTFGFLCEYGGGKFVWDGFDWQFEPGDEPAIDPQLLD